jgi:hypothetical protein
MKTRVKIFVLACLVTAMSAGCAGVMYVPAGPPAARVEVRSAKPGANHAWVAGHWKWNGNRYVWSNGRWMKNKKGSSWAPGHWKKAPSGHIWVAGYWH